MLVCLARCRMEPVEKIHISKMKLTGLHDLYDSWHLYIHRFLFGLSTLFWILTSWMSDVNKPNVGCRIFTSRMVDFNKSDVGCRMSDF